MNHDIDPQELDFLLRLPALPNMISPVDFLNGQTWGAIKVCCKAKACFKKQ